MSSTSTTGQRVSRVCELRVTLGCCGWGRHQLLLLPVLLTADCQSVHSACSRS
jgi:hypothetical protein